MATIRRKGPGKWHVQVRRKGHPQKTRTFRTKVDAEAWGRDVETKIDKGVYNPRDEGKRVTFGELIELYIEEITRKRPKENSRISEEARLRRFLREERVVCAYAVANLQPEHFEDYRDRRLQEPSPTNARSTISPSTVKRELNLLKRVIDHKMRVLGLVQNPVSYADVKRPTVNDERNVRLSPEELSRLLLACYSARNKYLGPIVEFALETGARQESILMLEWTDIKGPEVVFRAVKNSRNPEELIDHVTALSPRALEIINSLPKEEERIFPLSRDALRQAFERARSRAEVPHFRFHDIRHERASSLHESGWSMLDIMAVTGHKDPKSLKRYTNVSTGYIAKKLAALEKETKSKKAD